MIFLETTLIQKKTGSNFQKRSGHETTRTVSQLSIGLSPFFVIFVSEILKLLKARHIDTVSNTMAYSSISILHHYMQCCFPQKGIGY